MGPGGFFPTSPDLADILGRTNFDFENFYFLNFLGPKFLALARAWAGLGLGLGPGLGPGLGRASALGRGGPRVGSHGFPRVSTGFHGFPTGFHGFPRVSHGPGPRVGRALGS